MSNVTHTHIHTLRTYQCLCCVSITSSCRKAFSITLHAVKLQCIIVVLRYLHSYQHGDHMWLAMHRSLHSQILLFYYYYRYYYLATMLWC